MKISVKFHEPASEWAVTESDLMTQCTMLGDMMGRNGYVLTQVTSTGCIRNQNLEVTLEFKLREE